MKSLGSMIDDALGARERLRARPRHETARSLAAAAARWRDDPTLRAELTAVSHLSPEMVDAVVPLAAEPLTDVDAMAALAERELAGVTVAGPRLIAHVLASNVPALGLPAIALGCLAEAVVVVKSGRADPVSAPAFWRALKAVDPDLAATVVATYWPGGVPDREATLFARADVVVASGSDATMAVLRARVRRRLVAHGERASVAVVAEDADVGALALDVARYDQRGCLSPVAVYVAGDPWYLGPRILAALDALTDRLPRGPAALAERAAAQSVRGAADWEGAHVLHGPGGTVIVDGRARFAPTPGGRCVWVHPLPRRLADVLPAGRIECVGVAGVSLDIGMLERHGVARLCPVGRMQRPPLAWARGQQAPLRSLYGLSTPPRLEVESE